jgi:hypothetical protein
MVWLGLGDVIANLVATRYVDDYIQVFKLVEIAVVLCGKNTLFLGETMSHSVRTDICYPNEIHSRPFESCGKDQIHDLLAT